MLARLQQRILASLIIVSFCCEVIFSKTGQPWIGAGALFCITWCYAMALGLEFIALYVVQGRQIEDKATVLQLTVAWLAELSVSPRVFCWRQPFRANAEPDILATHHSNQRGVVLIHGFFCNRGFWSPWLRKFRELGIPAIAINLEPLFGSIDNHVLAIESAVAKMEVITGLPVVLVGHSMGGLAIRAWLRYSNADARVHRVVTVGTPHRGTWLARHSRAVNGRQMRIDSPWLRQLESDEPPQRAGLFSCCFSRCDNIVFPADLAVLPGAASFHVAGAAHVQLAFKPAVFKEALRWLRKEDSLGPHASNARQRG